MKKRVIVILASCILIVAAVIGVFQYYHQTDYAYPYNDQFILGNTREKIVERHGEFDRIDKNVDGDLVCGAYMIQDDTPELIMSYDDSLWYEIYFENEIAVRVNLREGRIGG